MEMEAYRGYQYVDGGVCASDGFVAGGLNCGLNPDKNKNDLCLVYSETSCDTAAVYTTNKVKGAPILVTKENLKQSGGKAKAIVANSKNANTCNANGMEIARSTCDIVAKELGIESSEVIVASTGVIGQPMTIEPFLEGIPRLAGRLTVDGHADAANAIMTTDTVPKEVAVAFTLDGKTCHLGGMAKGSGMIHPNMATTLNFITSDVAISSEMIQEALADIVKLTYNCLTIDGDTSTNDMVSVMANGLSGNTKITAKDADYEVFKQALYIVMLNMTRMLAKDGEGASKLLECIVSGAPDLDTAIAVAKSVAGSTLFKCALFGEDANCGRIMCAIGYADGDFAIDEVSVILSSLNGSIVVCEQGNGVNFSEEKAADILSQDEITVLIDLHQGEAEAKAWGCDMTYDYVKINGDYRS